MKNLVLGSIALLFSMQSSAFATVLGSIPICQEGKPECLDLVIQEMEQRYKPLEAQRDRDGIFALSFLGVTETSKKLLSTVGFDNPASIVQQSALLADYYFQAYDAYHTGADVPTAWKIAFDAAENKTVSGGGNLTLSTSAHLLHDLTFVLYELSQKGTPVSYEDHNRFNQILLNVNVLEELAQKYDPTIDDADVPGTDDDLQRFQVVALWRELAFRNYEKLRDATRDNDRALVVAEIEELSTTTATTLFETFKNPPPPVRVPEPSTAPVLLVLGGVLVSITGLKAALGRRAL